MKKTKSTSIILSRILGISLIFINLAVSAQTDQFNNLEQYLFPEFSKSTMKMKVGKDLTVMLNYNLVTEKMVFMQKDQVYDLLNPEAVDSAIINGRIFVHSGKTFQELALGGSVSLYIQHRGNLVDPGKPAAYGGTSQVSSSTYVTRLDMGTEVYNLKLPEELHVKYDPMFWISINNNNFNFVNERQFIKIFPGKEKEIKSYIKQNHLKFENQEDVKKLVQYCQSLVK